MLVRLPESLRRTPQGHEAEAILRSCVHCGFCNATCPTYQLLGDELDGPRGRIYLIKNLLEDETGPEATRRHLDRCLTCLSCETTCPSGVRYGQLLEIAREHLESRHPRPWRERLLRRGLRLLLTRPRLLRRLLPLGRAAGPLLPKSLHPYLRAARPAPPWPRTPHHSLHTPGAAGNDGAKHPKAASPGRRMILLEGCAQAALRPDLNVHTARLLQRLEITALRPPRGGCCGALSLHLGARTEARHLARANIDAWWPQVEAGAEAIVSHASACSLMLKDYGRLLADDGAYRDKAARIAALSRDLTEVLAAEEVAALRPRHVKTIAFHAPCTLQHGLGLAAQAEDMLRRCGFRLLPVADAHLCCGAAGTYSLLQPDLSHRLRERKLAALTRERPDCIATANIGCLLHLQGAAVIPVRHWLELLAEED